jgi:hypothetical protein
MNLTASSFGVDDDKLNQLAWIGGALYRSTDSGGAAPRLSSGCSGLAFGRRIPVASNSVTTMTPGTGSSIMSTMTVSTAVVPGGFRRLAFVGTTFFATERFDLALVTRFLFTALAVVRFAVFPRMDLAALRALPRVATFPLRAAARFFR